MLRDRQLAAPVHRGSMRQQSQVFASTALLDCTTMTATHLPSVHNELSADTLHRVLLALRVVSAVQRDVLMTIAMRARHVWTAQLGRLTRTLLGMANAMLVTLAILLMLDLTSAPHVLLAHMTMISIPRPIAHT